MSTRESKSKPAYDAANVRDRLRTHWKYATPEQVKDGRDWYKHALAHAVTMAVQHGVSVRTAAGVIATLSPQHTWAQNLKLAEQCLGGEKLGCFKKMAQRAESVRDGGPVSGPKVIAFFFAIMGNEDFVVLDRWMLRAMGLPDTFGLTPKRYVLLADELRGVAEEIGVAPAVLQATVWCVVRGKSF